MMKYSVIVIAGGTIVCIQMRTTRRDLLAHDRPEADEIDAPRFGSRASRALDRELGHADLRSCLSTSRMNSSSSRFVFVRMLETWRSCAESCANTSLRPCPFATSTSIRARCEPHGVAVERRRGARLHQAQHEYFELQLAEDFAIGRSR